MNISRQIAQLNNVDDILLYIVDAARSLLVSDFIGIALLGEEQSKLMLKCHAHGSHSEILEPAIPINNSFILRALHANHSFRSQPDTDQTILSGVCPQLKKPARSMAVVPLRMDNDPIGVLWTARCSDSSLPYDETDLIWLECISDQIVIAIQHGLMTSQLQTLSIVEERGRIAREMHDGLAQVLGYLNLQVQTLEALFKQNKSDALKREMDQMRNAIKTAHADVRENILSLRTTLATEKGLLSSIEEYLEEFGIQTGIGTSFENEFGQALNLSSIAEVQLVCILQEALANVRKHSGASEVSVKLYQEKIQSRDYVCMEVNDNGTGFSGQESNRSFGLQTMNERADSVDGILGIQSSVGKGTTIVCRLPCLRQEELGNQSVLLQEQGTGSL